MLYRTFFLYLSRRRWLRNLILKLGPTRKASRRFVAGETREDAIRAVRALAAQKILSTLDHLGESVETEAQARAAAQECLDLLDRIAVDGLDAYVSIKLTQLGLDVSGDLCRELVASILGRAAGHGEFVRFDMEGSPHTQRTLDLYRDLRKKFQNCGIVLQAYLQRTEDDLKDLVEEGIANVRLCKGAYREPADIAFARKADVDANMSRLLRILLSDDAREKGAYLAMATHDERLIEETREQAARRGIPLDAFEFQMLYGIRRDLQQEIAAAGYKMRVYVPYGGEWYPYFMRRLAERPANLRFVLSNLFRR